MKEIRSITTALRKYYSSKITKEELRKLLKSGVIGRVTGVIGPFVLRYQKGKLIISNRPLYYNTSQSASSILGRKNFTSNVKFAKFLNADPLIKSIWKEADIEGTNAWTRLMKYNNIKNQIPTTSNVITPKKYHFEMDQICILGNDYRIIINDNLKHAQNDILYVIIVPFDPKYKNDNPYEILSVSGTSSDDLALNDEQISICQRYKKYVLYTAVIRMNGSRLEWSNTTSAEGTFALQSKEEQIEDAENSIQYWFLVMDSQIPDVYQDFDYQFGTAHRCALYYLY